jgi:hypothetical protein
MHCLGAIEALWLAYPFQPGIARYIASRLLDAAARVRRIYLPPAHRSGLISGKLVTLDQLKGGLLARPIISSGEGVE